MRRPFLILAGLAAAVGVVLLVLLMTAAVPRQRLVDGYVLFVGGLLLFGLAHATGRAGGDDGGSVYERALRRRARAPERPRELAKLEREVVLAATSSFDLYARLRPLLREIAAHRLESRRGADLDAGSTETRAVLGDDLWELLRPDREPPDDRHGPGLAVADQRKLVERLERI